MQPTCSYMLASPSSLPGERRLQICRVVRSFIIGISIGSLYIALPDLCQSGENLLASCNGNLCQSSHLNQNLDLFVYPVEV